LPQRKVPYDISRKVFLGEKNGAINRKNKIEIAILKKKKSCRTLPNYCMILKPFLAFLSNRLAKFG
jgi:predicted transcriptional regulator of viral defense system